MGILTNSWRHNKLLCRPQRVTKRDEQCCSVHRPRNARVQIQAPFRILDEADAPLGAELPLAWAGLELVAVDAAEGHEAAGLVLPVREAMRLAPGLVVQSDPSEVNEIDPPQLPGVIGAAPIQKEGVGGFRLAGLGAPNA